ncbi:hypothetical protein FSARC_14952 [Fusarium sarcochroum]|uniref:DUF3533 domain-containing protein n=1 Tax=Fusarium sarcochroum TaxID=1208366 RepID=A0A8H4SPV5_9HYPO|nr:hypothetical protein FSARC_14952 [Fusarium sarcochroum]
MLPPRSPNRHPVRSSYWTQRWPGFIVPVAKSGLLLQLLFLANMSYLYGALFQSSDRVHALSVLAVDYDGGEIGQALRLAYNSTQASNFPTLEFHTPSEFPNPDHLETAVCRGGYWAAIYAHQGATERLFQAIDGTNTSVYDPGDAISYMYNGIVYPVVAASMIDANLRALVTIATQTFYTIAPEVRAAVNLSDPTIANVFLNPIQASTSITAPTNQGTRVLFNTVSMVMPQLMQFFFIMGLNAVFTFSGVFATMSKRDIFLIRLFLNKVFGLASGLAMAGYIWAFRESWEVSTGQFFQTWMCLWLFMDINFQVVDTFIEVLIPMRYWAYFFLSWIIINVTSTVWPFELSSSFYRLGYALPAHNIWTLLMTIWSRGCRNQNKVALPVLLAWWVIGHITSAWSARKRCLLNETVEQSGSIRQEESPASTGEESLEAHHK